MSKTPMQSLRKIRGGKKEMVASLTRWSNQNSHSDNVEGLSCMLELLENHFSSLAGKARRIPLTPRRHITQSGEIVRLPQGSALQIVKRPKAPIRLLLAGHMDTVFTADSPFQKATIKGSRIMGPGVADMKGGLLVMHQALEALETSPWAGQIGWEVLITPDEETGSTCSESLYVKAAKRNHAGLIFEPSFPDGWMVSSRKGSRNLILIAKGKSVHVGRDFFAGRNAATALASVLLDIEQLTNSSEGILVNIGTITSNGAFNIVPDFAMAKVNIRTDNKEDEAMTAECVQLLLEEANRRDGISLKVHELAARSPKPLDEGSLELFNLFNRCSGELGTLLQWRPTGGVCDGNILAGCGLPTLDTLGVIGGNLHTHEEYAEIDSLPERACLTALFLLKLAAGEIRLPASKGA